MLGQLNPVSREINRHVTKGLGGGLKVFLLLVLTLGLLGLYDLGAIVLYPRLSKASCLADTIVVMGAAQYNGVPSPAFQRRLDKALELYEQGCGSSILVTGGARVGDNYSEGLTGAAYLYAFGVPRESLFSETSSTTSYQNLEFSKDLLATRNVTIVTDDLHAYRTWYLAKRLGYSSEVVGVFAPYQRWLYGFKEFLKVTAYHFGVMR